MLLLESEDKMEEISMYKMKYSEASEMGFINNLAPCGIVEAITTISAAKRREVGGLRDIINDLRLQIIERKKNFPI